MNIKLHLMLINLLWILLTSGEPLVTITQGTLNGTIQKARYGRKYSAFLGIPYALPPTGNRRFKNPEPAANWVRVRSAISFGNACPQMDNGKIFGKDDCLFLNVYSPFLNFEKPVPSDKLLPVMVYIHGGSFYLGSSNMVGADYLLEKEIILVTINYRLGILGFLTTGDAVAPGNFGMKDQVEALKWVQKNIKSFGGDSKKVTLFGQSAGGASVNLHALSPASNGLFQKYIMQSGTVLGPGGYQDQKDFEIYVKELAKKFQCPESSSQLIINCLRQVNSDDLIKKGNVAENVLLYGRAIWVPTIEPNNPGAFLTEKPLNMINNNQTKDLPFMSGTCADEASPWPAYTNFLLYIFFRLNARTLIDQTAKYYNQNPAKFFKETENFYFNNRFYVSSKNEFLKVMTKFSSDAAFFYPQIRTLEKSTPKMKNNNYFYNFGYRGALSMTAIGGDKKNYGVAHGDDLLYLFPISNFPFVTTNANFKSADERISRIMVDFWTSFATNGKPTSSELQNPNLWEPYSPKTAAHIQIGNIMNNEDPTITMSNNYYTERINFWRKNAPM